MTLLKVCGITRAEDAAVAYVLGYNAVGFVFARSPRQVDPEKAREICSSLSPSILRVGVFTDEELGDAQRIMDYCGLDMVQLHGEMSEKEIASFGYRAIVSLRPRVPEDLRALEYCGDAFAVLIDSWDPVLEGGTGTTGDWDLASIAGRRARIILAGGLRASNVGRALAEVRPFGVDVSSGVELEPGVKDHMLMRDFARAVRGFYLSGADEEGSDVER
jgi:phosphoribosylanthranilate isomerase